MIADCANLAAFVDGHLPPEAHEGFLAHLAGCEACGVRFHDLLQLDVLGRLAMEGTGSPQAALEAVPLPAAVPAPQPLPPPEPVRPGRRPWRVAGGLALAVGMAAVTGLPGRTAREAPLPWRTSAANRPLEARLTYAAAGGHRPYVPQRGALPEVTPPPLRELVALEDREDWHGLSTAYLLSGDPRQALTWLQRAPATPDLDSDRAVAVGLGPAKAGEQGPLDEALRLLEGTLRARPDHPQALWNRALVLRDMDLPLLAADSFEAVAKQGEPGWSAEAAARARALRERTQARGRAWKQAQAATQDLMTDPGARLPLEEAGKLPGIVRVAFYDAVRAAASRDAALRLLPLAEALDRAYGGTRLREYVTRVAEHDFRLRGPLARDYVRFTQDKHPSREAFLEALRRSGEDDLYVGALGYELNQGRPVDVEAFVRAADGLGDPWFHLIAEQTRANREVRDGQWWKAEARVLEALRTCEAQGLAYRCARLQLWLSDMYLQELHRPADAWVHAVRGWQLAKQTEEWELERQFLQALGQVARLGHALPTASAYLRESLSRTPDAPAQRSYVHRNLANVAWLGFRIDEAREEMEQTLESGGPLEMAGALVLSDLARFGPLDGAADAMRRTLTELRHTATRPGERALTDFIEGQFELERDRTAGRGLLWSAITQAEQWPADANARRARGYAHAALISEAGRTGAFAEALALVERQLRVSSVPDTCVLAVSVQHERTVAVVRGATGEVLGSLDSGRTTPLGKETSGLVPAPLQQALRDCAHVEVLAPPPVNGLPGLLPPDMAWSYRVGRGATAGLGPKEGAHLVVAGVDAPAALGLPRLAPMEAPSRIDPRRVTLEGARATPSRVLEALSTATEVEIHTHGVFSPELSDASLLVLSPEADGRYALTADQVRSRKLSGAPLVLLAACGAAHTAPFPHESFSLPVAFVEAGARAVLAATVAIPDTAGRFFDAVRERIRAGVLPSIALRDERRQWLSTSPDAGWVRDVLLFE
ncbi:CHAT domain-containing protein [Corallococcus sp. bb12-1]|uniref:CHAT domain-containing protein n=1 Tax=Corallococcus sp. bb12-1 TaxID=2996784 RepID=UPI00226D6B41|nr:CHAT domain-containing protein [Corallococcus sp. bb12-1]MCY1043269.1 CHAT domain-containing protein [Corallococcus sp. bb12-1]